MSPYPLQAVRPFDAGLVEPSVVVDGTAKWAEMAVPRRGTLGRGQTLGELLAELRLEPAAAIEISATVAQYANLNRLRAGDPYVAYLGPGQNLEALELEFPARGRVRVERSYGAWRGAWHPVQRSTALRTVQGEVDGAFEAAVTSKGVPASLAYNFADVFRWDIDFNRDLRAGDRFSAVYELVSLDGEPSLVGRVLAASYTLGDRSLEAYRFEDGYYDAEGRPLKKMFLRSPMKFTRITSGFTHRRFHPVLKRYRPHYGVDYGAPTGTPVYVTAGGVVEFAAYSGGSGNLVKVRHPNGYLTAYLHLSRFGRGISAGARVQQGDLIGYVGSTGLATGPHLDYRVQINEEWIDPLSLKSIPAEPIAEERLAEFREWRDQLRATLVAGRSMGRDEQQLLAAVQSTLAELEAAAVSTGG
ncbi:MAG: peptidoglycan DD-metalloendopeptidase family protein [Thermoanaerobaculia bacterium]